MSKKVTTPTTPVRNRAKSKVKPPQEPTPFHDPTEKDTETPPCPGDCACCDCAAEPETIEELLMQRNLLRSIELNLERALEKVRLDLRLAQVKLDAAHSHLSRQIFSTESTNCIGTAYM